MDVARADGWPAILNNRHFLKIKTLHCAYNITGTKINDGNQ